MADEIKASPQGALARFLGSVGQTAYRAGRGMDEAMDPIRASNPVKTTLADFLLTSPLRSAGNALQDWTGTPRDIPPEEPYSRLLSGKGMTTRLDPRILDVAQFAQPVGSRAVSLIRGLPAALKDAALAAYGPMATASHVIKPPSGNWLRGDVESGLKVLKPIHVVHDPLRQAIRSVNLGPRWLKEAQRADIFTPEQAALYKERFPSQETAYSLPDIRAFLREVSPDNPLLLPEEQITLEHQRSKALSDWVDKQLTGYVKNDMATPEDPVRLALEAWPAQRDAQVAQKVEKLKRLEAKLPGAEPRVVPYLNRDIDAVRDEIQAIRDYNPSHMQDLEHIWPNAASPGTRVTQTRRQGGFPEEGMGVSPLARAWELGADSTTRNTSAGEFMKRPQYDVYGAFPMSAYDEAAALRHIASLTQLAETEPAIAAKLKRFPMSFNPTGPVHTNPWLAKVPPETPVYSMDNLGGLNNLGFDHLIDELKNAVNPESGLPRELLLKPESLARVSVPQAVERVAKINEWRQAQKVMADAAKAQNSATFTHKEYPEQGYKWVELKQAEAPTGIPEGWTQIEDKAGVLRAVSPDGQRVLGNNMPELIKNIYSRHPDAPGNPRKALEEALKYEGDTMGHCVGGYCPDVAEGRSRIFSLRDRKGQPHTTIEVKPVTNTFEQWHDNLPEDLYQAYKEDFIQKNPALAGKAGASPEWVEYLRKFQKAPGADEVTYKINQIKGKGNRAPNEEYLPFVQDFVRSQPWSEIGDSQNAGLRRYWDVFNANELRKIEAAGEAVPEHEWLTGEDIQRLHNRIYPEGQRLKYDASGNIIDDAEKFASGGIVEYHPLDVDARVDELKRELNG